MKFIVDKVEIVKKESEDRIMVDGKEVARKVPFDYFKTKNWKIYSRKCKSKCC